MSLKIKLLSASLLFLGLNVIAQSLPSISYKNYGFENAVSKVESVYYNLNKQPKEKSAHQFTKNGFIESSLTENLQEKTWLLTKSSYKKGKLNKRIFQSNDASVNKKHTYKYNAKNELEKETIIFKNGQKNQINFTFENGRLKETIAHKYNSLTTIKYFYSEQGNLYKTTKTLKKNNQPDVITNSFYLENKEITSYVEPQSNFKVSTYLDNLILKFNLTEDEKTTERLLKGMQRFNKEAPKDNLPFGLESYSNQTLQFYSKNKDKLQLTEVVLFEYITDKQNHKIAYAEAHIDLNTNTIAGIRFYKTTLANGEILGNTAYEDAVLHKFQDMLEAVKAM
ncbi:hypothetical protein PK35_15355 [Tamlana nanhaiensis]|uniref:Uncharacterized protein n=1 Tax=Neotamlana nanhaiensis TaxID=1382798 RepID=A0A0D7VWM1_9FLAO|nr:hypothetical protein [Tamlana nanhaiensis]KJD31214.1 hypothetical protein PK35_15355 [Tamlana nanhaiensis]